MAATTDSVPRRALFRIESDRRFRSGASRGAASRSRGRVEGEGEVSGGRGGDEALADQA